MEFFVLRRDEKLGPYRAYDAREMISSGKLRAGDLVWYEGADGWIPVAVFVEAVEKARSESGNAEADDDTVLREVAEAERSYFDTLPGEPEFAGRTNPDSLSEEERQVIDGARIVQFSYCWSFLFVTFRRKSKPMVFMPNEDGFIPAFKYSMISLLFGWWGIPLGPIWTITSFLRNCDGGNDITMTYLSERYGQARAASACAKHRATASQGPMMRILGPVLFGVTLILFVGLTLGVTSVVRSGGDPVSSGPGAGAFEKADNQLKVAEDGLIIGSSHDSIDLAQSFAAAINSFYNAYLSTDVKDYAGTNEVSGTTFCDARRDRVVLLVRLPELKGLPDANRKAVGDHAWRLAQETIERNKAGFTGLRVVLGIRSYSMYDQAMIGEYTRDYSPTNSGINSRSFGPQSKLKLVPFFAPELKPDGAE